MHKIKCTVQSVKGFCSAGYKAGDAFYVKEAFIVEADTPKGVCLHALSAMAPYLTAYARHTDPDDWINQKKEFQCPDSTNSVVFGVERWEEK
jgi:uncharacterized repeat protein (TIGR04076 family)